MGTSAFANTPGGGSDTGPDVVLTDNGTTVVLDNGTVRATIVKISARVSSLLYQGFKRVATGSKALQDGPIACSRETVCFSSQSSEMSKSPRRPVGPGGVPASPFRRRPYASWALTIAWKLAHVLPPDEREVLQIPP